MDGTLIGRKISDGAKDDFASAMSLHTEGICFLSLVQREDFELLRFEDTCFDQARNLPMLVSIIVHGKHVGAHSVLLCCILINGACNRDQHSPFFEYLPGALPCLSTHSIENKINLVHDLLGARSLIINHDIGS